MDNHSPLLAPSSWQELSFFLWLGRVVGQWATDPTLATARGPLLADASAQQSSSGNGDDAGAASPTTFGSNPRNCRSAQSEKQAPPTLPTYCLAKSL